MTQISFAIIPSCLKSPWYTIHLHQFSRLTLFLHVALRPDISVIWNSQLHSAHMFHLTPENNSTPSSLISPFFFFFFWIMINRTPYWYLHDMPNTRSFCHHYYSCFRYPPFPPNKIPPFSFTWIFFLWFMHFLTSIKVWYFKKISMVRGLHGQILDYK